MNGTPSAVELSSSLSISRVVSLSEVYKILRLNPPSTSCDRSMKMEQKNQRGSRKKANHRFSRCQSQNPSAAQKIGLLGDDGDLADVVTERRGVRLVGWHLRASLHCVTRCRLVCDSTRVRVILIIHGCTGNRLTFKCKEMASKYRWQCSGSIAGRMV